MKPSEILDKAARKIEPEGRWTRQYSARDKDGREVAPNDAAATCWCIYGAIMKVSRRRKVRGDLFRFLPTYASVWNDAPERTQAEVVAKLREAAALARAEGQ